MAEFPFISIIIPTLNSARTLERCLQQIRCQNYPFEQIEILICDGGSIDSTLKIAAQYQVDYILENSLKTGEAGKAIGLKHSKGGLIAFIDSDNFLVGQDWLRRMVIPFQSNSEIVMAEPLFFHWDSQAPSITRYCALMGLNDPLCFFMGNFDHWNFALKKWTGFKIPVQDAKDWFWFELSSYDTIPTLGANGVLYQRRFLEELPFSDYFFDVDVPHQLLVIKRRLFAKVRTSILHWYCPSIKDFVKKQRRRVTDYLFYKKKATRVGHLQSYSYRGVIRFILSIIFVVPCLNTSIRGFLRKPDLAWFLHWPLSAITLWIYGMGVFRFWLKPILPDRSDWQADRK